MISAQPMSPRDVPNLEGARARFMAKVEVTADGHWTWLPSKSDLGWFRLATRLNVTQANRAAWLLFVGDLAPGDAVVTCPEQVRCIRPEHARKRTVAQAAKIPRWRPAGEEVHHKLTRAQVLSVAVLRAEGLTHKAIAQRLGVTDGAIGHILRGWTWSRITGIPKRQRR